MLTPVSFPVIQSNSSKKVETKALIDCGARGRFIDQNFIRRVGLKTTRLKFPLPAYNVDGTLNKTGTIRHYVKLPLWIGGRTRNEVLLVSGLGKNKIILGIPWLRDNNPDINWKRETMRWRDPEPSVKVKEEEPEEEDLTEESLVVS